MLRMRMFHEREPVFAHLKGGEDTDVGLRGPTPEGENRAACDQAHSGRKGVVSRDPSAPAGPDGYGHREGQKSLPGKEHTVRELNYQLKQLCRHNRDGSYRTQADREGLLMLIANQLHALGYRKMQAKSLKPKHVEALVAHWQETDISTGAIKNRLSVIRWWAMKVARQNVVARSNDHYGIPERRFVTNESKAREFTETQLDKVKDEHVRMSLELQRVFGLRREEAIKFQPVFADQGDHIKLKASWTKGGKSRVVPIRNEAQRAALEHARLLVGRGALIPSARNYVQQMRIYERHTANAGLSRMHGLRHAYAQQRYRELTGWSCPAAGGPARAALSTEQRELDREVRLAISRELGHERPEITAVYCGK